MICNHFYNAEAGVKDKQNGTIIFFRGPNTGKDGSASFSAGSNSKEE